MLEDIKVLLKLPDSEKQRQRHIELGMKFSKSALKDADLIIDAINEFEAALVIMPQDWFVLFQLGMCYLYHNKIQDLEKAEELFLKAAKYSSVDSLTDSTLGTLFNDSFLNNIQSKENIKNESPTGFSSECYLQAALINYIKGEYENSVKWALKSTNVDCENAKTFFFLAKYQSKINQYYEAILSLETADKLSESIYKTFLADIDILNNPLFHPYYIDLLPKAELNYLKIRYDFIHKNLFKLILNSISKERIEFLSDNTDYITLKDKFILFREKVEKIDLFVEFSSIKEIEDHAFNRMMVQGIKENIFPEKDYKIFKELHKKTKTEDKDWANFFAQEKIWYKNTDNKIKIWVVKTFLDFTNITQEDKVAITENLFTLNPKYKDSREFVSTIFKEDSCCRIVYDILQQILFNKKHTLVYLGTNACEKLRKISEKYYTNLESRKHYNYYKYTFDPIINTIAQKVCKSRLN